VLKKLFCLVLCFLFTLFFLSCSEEKDEGIIRIGFSQAMSNDDWRRSMNYSMRLQASLNPKIDLIIKDANYQVAKQIEQIESFIADSLDILIVSPIQSKPITSVVQKALNAGIPVLVVDRKTESQHYTAYLGADNIEVGKNAAKEIITSNFEDTIRIIEIKGLTGSSPAEERGRGFQQIINQSKKAQIVATIEGDWEKESIRDQLRLLLKEGVKVDYIFAHNDRMAIGAWEIAHDLGMEKTINFIGVDGLSGTSGGIQAVKNGILKATVLYPTGGDEAIKLALKILNKESISKDNILSSVIINELNADIMDHQVEKINEQQAEIQVQLEFVKNQKKLFSSQKNLLKITITLLAIIISLAIYNLYSIFCIQKKNRQLVLKNHKITIQKKQIQKIAKEVKVSNEAKLKFFTGLSHEFKTPITLILSSIESMNDLVKEKGLKMRNEVELIYNNSNRLLRLINQLLDFRKIEDRKFNLKASKTNLFGFSKIIFKDFEHEAKKRNIDYKLICNNDLLNVFMDRDLMDKVYFNLLSNAFKFTSDNGKIEIRIEDDESINIVNIYFKDSGIGIPQNEMDEVFQAFFKGSNNRKNSSGIGLHLSKEFVEMHKGTIKVKSVHGSEFIIGLYKGKAHFDESEIIPEQDLVDTNIIDFTSKYFGADDYLIQAPDKGKEKYSVLIIEDDRDLSLFLKNKLQLEYEIHLSDGTDAIEKAFETIPDIILCDINLPHKDGFEICEILKKDLRSSHIPTIMLTALDNKESYLKGLQSGADLYLTKPFSYSILVQSIKSLVYNREKLRYYYTSNIHKMLNVDSFGNIEQQFIHKLNDLIQKNLGNDDFSVEHLAESLNISRVQLYRKIKAMMGINISDYISNMRLEKAKIMIEASSLTVSEIAYANGFSSPNYFSTVFKNKYGASPTSFRKFI
jgi:ABC-type sugar transport system substrate-binding protein/DNA-binding response OmpR family regulator